MSDAALPPPAPAAHGDNARPRSAIAPAATPGPPVYIVVGGTGGIGRALIPRLIGRGAKVVFSGRNAERVADGAREFSRLAPADAPALSVHGEVIEATDAEDVKGLFDAALSLHGRIDGVVNLAGGLVFKPLHTTTDAEWRACVDANLTTAFVVLREAARAMAMRGGGSVVLVSSGAASVGMGNHEAIAAAKAGVEGLALSAAASYAKRNLRVNVVAPGLVRTPLTESIWGKESGARAATGVHPLGRLGEPSDVARVIDFLLDPANAWITGQVWGVDGGLARLRA